MPYLLILAQARIHAPVRQGIHEPSQPLLWAFATTICGIDAFQHLLSTCGVTPHCGSRATERTAGVGLRWRQRRLFPFLRLRRREGGLVRGHVYPWVRK